MVSGSQVLWAMWKCDEARSCGTDDAMSEVWTDGIPKICPALLLELLMVTGS